MKVLVAGLGSIGQRHVRNLRQVLGDRVDILAFRARGGPGVIGDDMTLQPEAEVERHYGLRSFDRLEAALDQRPDAVFVCNPTCLHAETAIAAVRAGAHVFVEKPLSDRYEQIEELIALAEARQRVAAVGYQLRFHPALIRVRDLLRENAIGDVVSVRAEMGEYLPDAHPYEDYRQSYAARADLGGGVILCYIHEFDYLCWLFGTPARVSTFGGRLGSLQIDVEDTAATLLEFNVKGRALVAQVHQSFLQRPPSRTLEIIGAQGTIRVDFRKSSLQVDRVGTPTESVTYSLARNDLFIDELRHFLAALDGQPSSIATLRDGAESLRVALAAKASLATGQAVSLS